MSLYLYHCERFRIKGTRKQIAHQKLFGGKSFRPLETAIGRFQTHNAVRPEAAQLLAKTAITDRIPAALPVNNAVRVEYAFAWSISVVFKILHFYRPAPGCRFLQNPE